MLEPPVTYALTSPNVATLDTPRHVIAPAGVTVKPCFVAELLHVVEASGAIVAPLIGLDGSLRGVLGLAYRQELRDRDHELITELTQRLASALDNDALRDVTCGMLGELGCAVTGFADADAAAAALDLASIDLLVTDCVMPGELNGPRLCEALRERRADLPVLFISGFRADAEELPTRAATFLAKPFDATQLQAAVGSLMNPG